jgi:DNA-binding PadR family transcriptional regulator
MRDGRASEPGLLVLVSLLEGPRHGYAMSEDIERMTGRRPGPGTLYGAISRLEAAGLIEALAGDARRKPYALTTAGVEHARAELRKLSALADEGTRRLKAMPA